MIIPSQIPLPDSGMKILTPWWDMMTRYLTGGIMTIALTTAALQAAKDQLVCIPTVACIGAKVAPSSPITEELRSTCMKVIEKLQNGSSREVMTTMVDRRQYDFVDAKCFQTSLDSYSTYFPFILVAMAACLLVIDNIWVMYPKTSSTLNHFVTLTMECYASVGTNSDIFSILSKTKDKKEGESDEDMQAEDAIIFDLPQAMKVKTLYDKVEQFRLQFDEKSKLLITVYTIQAILEMLSSLCYLVILCVYFVELGDSFDCELNEVFNTPYQYFVCSRFIARYYRAVSLIFGAAIALYFITSVYTLIWTLRNSFRQNISADIQVDDSINIKGDLAFLFSLLEQYNKLYCDRLALFLSYGCKQSLLDKIEADRKRRKTQRRAGSEKHGVDGKGGSTNL